MRWFEWCEALGRAEPGVIGAFESQQTGSIRLRRARHDDGPAVGHIHATSFRTYLPTVPQIHDDADIERYFSGLVDTQECWIAEEDGSPIGFCILRVDDGSVRNDDGDTPADDGDVHWLDHLYLAAGHTCRGAGSQLVRLAKERRPGGLQLWTFQVNAGARRFYEGHGFVASEFTGGAGNEEYTPDVRYLWRPTP